MDEDKPLRVQIDNQVSAFIRMDSTGAVLVEGLEKWIDRLAPTGVGVRMQDTKTGAIFTITKEEP